MAGRWPPPPRQGGDRFWCLIPWLKPFALCLVPFRDMLEGELGLVGPVADRRSQWEGRLGRRCFGCGWALVCRG